MEAKLNWDCVPFGFFPDSCIAEYLGVTRYYVSKERQRRGIKNHSDFMHDFLSRQPLGKIPDYEIRNNTGLSINTILLFRKKHGIEMKIKKTCDVCKNRFFTKHDFQRYCSNHCAQSYHSVKRNFSIESRELISCVAGLNREITKKRRGE